MKPGVAGLELEVTLAFHDDGTLSGMQSIAADGIALPEHISTVLWRYLQTIKPADALIEAAWENADDEADDAGCDEARMPGAAE